MKRSEDGQREPESVRGSGHFEKSMETLGGPDPEVTSLGQEQNPASTAKDDWGDIDD
ncbi:hypothetical protein [Nocardia alba]|uniref:Uncharacterized protein n=1 Tax=Nocardia alba TaxID=225051 RepID=A0A4R1F6N8_9NOCA|nr:hypothetical protein [Nocardia alba]TCJ89967.1 hypothetical protein DFR71_6258 [Nocardia alba]